jgi:Anti-sigma factor NepR
MHSPEDSPMTWIATADRWVGLKLAEVIGRDLRSLYSEVLHMPLPEHLTAIVERLEVHGRGDRSP